jgi:hypothetical protein
VGCHSLPLILPSWGKAPVLRNGSPHGERRKARRWLLHHYPGDLGCHNAGVTLSQMALSFQLEELQKEQHEARLAVTPLKVPCTVSATIPFPESSAFLLHTSCVSAVGKH